MGMRTFSPLPRPFALVHLRRHPLVTAAAMILAAAAISLVTGCAASDQVAPAPTTGFTATVSGAVQTPLAGSAVLFALPATVVDSTAVPPSSILGMADRTTRTVVAFKWQNVAALAAGSYPVGTDTSSVAMMYDEGTGAPGSTFSGSAGSVTITSATPQSVAGSYSVTARAEDTGDTITVSGTFTAAIQAGPIN